MDAVKFVKEYLRICSQPWDCEDCPLNKTDFCSVPPKERSQEKAEEVVRLVEEWSAAHPLKTRQSVFLEQYPETRVDADGIIDIEPCLMLKRYRYKGEDSCDDGDGDCFECRRKFWMQEVE